MDQATRFCQDLLPSLEDSVIAELKCLACKRLMHPPVYHCERGHSVCGECYKIGDNCKWCGSNCANTRTHHLERISDALTYPCKHFGKGCHKRYHPKKLKQHEEECQTIRIKCPLRLGARCSFIGTKKQIVFHCQLAHGHFTFVGEKRFKQRILHTNFFNKSNSVHQTSLETPTFQSFYVYYVNDTLFQGLVQLESASIKVRMCRISSPSEMEDGYEFVMKLFDFHDNILESFHKQCCVSDGCEEIALTKENYLEISFGALKRCRYFTIEFIELQK